jgi:hypothetical protein
MEVAWISLIVSIVSLVVAVANLLLPVKEWLRYCFHRRWPPPERNDARRPAGIRLDDVVHTESTCSLAREHTSMTRLIEMLEAAIVLAGVNQTLGPPTPSGSVGDRADQHSGELRKSRASKGAGHDGQVDSSSKARSLG